MVQVVSRSKIRGIPLRRKKNHYLWRPFGLDYRVWLLCAVVSGTVFVAYNVDFSFDLDKSELGTKLRKKKDLTHIATSQVDADLPVVDATIKRELKDPAVDKPQHDNAPILPVQQQQQPDLHTQNGVSNGNPSFRYEYTYAPKELQKIDDPWSDWTPCDLQSAFQTVCHPRPATCTSIKDDVLNNHGIGNSLEVTYVKVASELMKEKPDCAPIIKDMPIRPTVLPGTFLFRLLDYVKEPTVVVASSNLWRDQNAKCITYAITQPREAVAEKVHIIQEKYRQHPEIAGKQYPLVAIHLRTGWSDEMQRNKNGWDALGSCQDYRDQFPVDVAFHAVSDVALKDMLLDAAAAADRAFGGTGKWRLYVASDAPGIRKYVQHLLQTRVVGPVVWHEGRIGHNYLGGMATNYDEKVDTSISAFTDLIVMSEADMLICLSSKFPAAANMRSGGCPQRFAQLQGHPRHGLAKTGDILRKAFSSRSKTSQWSPSLDDESKTSFFAAIPGGMNNPCTKAADPIRACSCLIKLSHA
ncbi:expressed unknown protein [Seminavis robusta]|uniref:O-fucosyltransferase family protein n=1 Tax=Seminavis robusta TaxID=568900 RepID=A0A9N8H1Q2_9STRA|nr:expressed unknown protein [Seminavis robusta]|eukprot:Sro6_g005280.1 n/a (525) ;mRNA; f:142585-144159